MRRNLAPIGIEGQLWTLIRHVGLKLPPAKAEQRLFRIRYMSLSKVSRFAASNAKETDKVAIAMPVLPPRAKSGSLSDHSLLIEMDVNLCVTINGNVSCLLIFTALQRRRTKVSALSCFQGESLAYCY